MELEFSILFTTTHSKKHILHHNTYANVKAETKLSL